MVDCISKLQSINISQLASAPTILIVLFAWFLLHCILLDRQALLGGTPQIITTGTCCRGYTESHIVVPVRVWIIGFWMRNINPFCMLTWTRLELKVMLRGKKDSSSETSQKNSREPVLERTSSGYGVERTFHWLRDEAPTLPPLLDTARQD